MPQNKRESLIYTVIMCFVMIIWMSAYNIALHTGSFSFNTIKTAWMGVPVANTFALVVDWFIVSKIAKGIAFRFLLKPEDSPTKKVLVISSGMVVLMCVFMSMYGAIETCMHTGQWNAILSLWIKRIPLNFIMALPFQLLIAGPLVRKLFRSIFPVGTVLA